MHFDVGCTDAQVHSYLFVQLIIIDAASKHIYRPLIQADATARCFACLIMNELKNLTNIVIGKLGKLVHKQNCSHDFLFFINYSIILYKLDTLQLKQKN